MVHCTAHPAWTASIAHRWWTKILSRWTVVRIGCAGWRDAELASLADVALRAAAGSIDRVAGKPPRLRAADCWALRRRIAAIRRAIVIDRTASSTQARWAERSAGAADARVVSLVEDRAAGNLCFLDAVDAIQSFELGRLGGERLQDSHQQGGTQEAPPVPHPIETSKMEATRGGVVIEGTGQDKQVSE